jgi:hypothetical protein
MTGLTDREVRSALDSALMYAALAGQRAEAIAEAMAIAETCAMYQGEHHKQWVIDQMIRALLGADYEDWRVELATVEAEWDEGVAP